MLLVEVKLITLFSKIVTYLPTYTLVKFAAYFLTTIIMCVLVLSIKDGNYNLTLTTNYRSMKFFFPSQLDIFTMLDLSDFCVVS